MDSRITRLAQTKPISLNGLTVRVMSGDQRPGRDIVLVHGLGSSGIGTWDLAAPRIAAACGGRVLAVDLHGHGEHGPRARRPFTVAACAADLRDLLDIYGLSEAVVVGHSLGGHVAIELAAGDLERRAEQAPLVGALIVGGTAATLPEKRLARIVEILDRLPTCVSAMAGPLVDRAVWFALREERIRQAPRQDDNYVGEFGLGDPRTIGSAALASQRSDVGPAAEAIHAAGLPCGVLVHTEDSRVPRAAQKQLATMLGAHVVALVGGHNLPWKEPSHYVRGIVDLLGRLNREDA